MSQTAIQDIAVVFIAAIAAGFLFVYLTDTTVIASA